MEFLPTYAVIIIMQIYDMITSIELSNDISRIIYSWTTRILIFQATLCLANLLAHVKTLDILPKSLFWSISSTFRL